MKPVRWGVLGTARIAMNRVIPAMQEVSICELAAIASRSAKKASAAAASAGIEKAHASYEALLADSDIEAVYIPLPNHLHLDWCTRALEAGKHVLCEKPIALDAAEAAELIAVRDWTGLLIEEAFAIRNHPQWAATREVLGSGEVTAMEVIRGTLPFYVTVLGLTILLLHFPMIALWLPSTMY